MTAKLSNTEAKLRELLILAAKAADIEITTWSNCQAGGFRKGGIGLFWNPATDDGDSRRLEVALCLQVAVGLHDGTVRVTSSNDSSIMVYEQYQFDEHSKCAATRLAVLRAAAEVGRKMG